MSVIKAYSSNRHWLIAEVLLSGEECDGRPDEAFTSQWFVITPEQQVRFLGSDMWLVDAGDYDHDGKSELVFSIDGDNRGGYKLFYDDSGNKPRSSSDITEILRNHRRRLCATSQETRFP